MIEVFLCCAAADREIAATIMSRLADNAEVTVVVDDGATESVAAKWEGGLSSAAILLLLSPDAVPAQVSRAVWQGALDHVTSNAEPPLGCLLVRSCGYPRLLERKNFFRWDTGPREALRAIEAWVMRLHPIAEQRSFAPAPLPWFEGRHAELDLLWETLVDRCGNVVVLYQEAATGKTSLAQEFARRAGAHFRDVLWVGCGGRSAAAMAGDLAEVLGMERCENDVNEDFARLITFAGKHRVLLVLDDFPPTLTVPAEPQGRASVLLTTRSAKVQAPGGQVIRVDDAPEVALEIPENPVDLRLWQAMAVCNPGGFPLDLAAEIAGIQPGDLPGARERLIRGRLVDPLDDAEGRLRLSRASIAAASGPLENERRRHAEVVHARVSQWAKNPAECERYMAEIVPALQRVADLDWRLACGLGRHAFGFLRSLGRVAEGAEFLVALRDAADLRGDWGVSDNCAWELSWIRGVPYRGADRAPVQGDQLSFNFAG